MTFVTAPDLIEQTDFNPGWGPDLEDPSADANVLEDVLNLLPEDGHTGAVETRKGFLRIIEQLVATGHYVRHIRPFKGNGTSYLIVVISDDSPNADNVQLWAINMEDYTTARMDTAGVTWANPEKKHWGIGIDEIY